MFQVCQRPLGRTKISISEVGIGTAEYVGGSPPIQRGIELGVTLIDTAESYGTEFQVGEAVKACRDSVLIATKASPRQFGRQDLLKAADESLQRLQTDYIDLYQLHWPSADIPIEETMEAMSLLIDSGKVRFPGVCNFSWRELEAAQAASRHPIVSNQVPYSLIDREIENELLPKCEAAGVTVIAYSPLARGPEKLAAGLKNGELEAVAEDAGRTIVQVALNWCLRSPTVVVIPKSRRDFRIEENCGASGWSLTQAQSERLSRARTPGEGIS